MVVVKDKADNIKLAQELIEYWESQGDDNKAFYYRGVLTGLSFGEVLTIFDEAELEEIF